MGVSVSSEMTAAALGEIGRVRHDPFAMLPFCGYHMGDYFAHWLKIGQKGEKEKLPRIFSVNWFRKNDKGKWLWPGFGENSRVLKWIFERVSGEAEDKAVKTPIGYVPSEDGLDMNGLDLPLGALKSLLHVDKEAWLNEVKEMDLYLKKFENRLPQGIQEELDALQGRLET
jgi:phosphoenolpyruvate carboxykinase (GTP)